MDLIRRLSEDQKAAMKDGDRTRTAVLRLLRTRIKEAQVAKREDLSEGDVLKIIMSEIKRRREAIDLFERGGRGDLATKEKHEVAILESYLPQKLSEDELRAEAQKAIEEVGASGPQDLGRVMKVLMPRISGRAEGSDASRIVKELLAKEG